MEGYVANPFEDENGVYHVLINDEGQHSLWPTFVDVPDGWTIIHKSDTRAACLDFINKNWTDMRPKSLIESMKALSINQPPAPSSEPDSATITPDNTLTPDNKTIH
jgi:MbtH protein